MGFSFYFFFVGPKIVFMDFAGILIASPPATLTSPIFGSNSSSANVKTDITLFHTGYFMITVSQLQVLICFSTLHPRITCTVFGSVVTVSTNIPTSLNSLPLMFKSTSMYPRYGIWIFLAADSRKNFLVSDVFML